MASTSIVVGTTSSTQTVRYHIDQICDYTEDAEHDDAPDSLASLCQRGRFHTGERVYHFG